MPHVWNDGEIQELWTLSAGEVALLPGMTDKGRLGFAVQLKFMQIHGRFPDRDEVDPSALRWVAAQLDPTPEALSGYQMLDRQGRRHRRTIRRYLGFRPATGNDFKRLGAWLIEEVLPFDPKARHATDAARDWCRAQRLEPPALGTLHRIIRSAVHTFETGLQETICSRLTDTHKAAIDRLLTADEPELDEPAAEGSDESVSFTSLKHEQGKAGLERLLSAIAKIECIDAVGLSVAMFQEVPAKFIDQFCQRCATESIRDLRRHPATIRYSMAAMYCGRRRQQLTDSLLDGLLQVIHNLGSRAEKKIDQRQFVQFKKVRGKARLLFKLAETTVQHPDGIIKEVVYPVVGQKTLQQLVAEFKGMGFDFEREVQGQMRSSYGHHYRRMLMPVLDVVRFESSNAVHRLVVDAYAARQ